MAMNSKNQWNDVIATKLIRNLSLNSSRVRRQSGEIGNGTDWTPKWVWFTTTTDWGRRKGIGTAERYNVSRTEDNTFRTSKMRESRDWEIDAFKTGIGITTSGEIIAMPLTEIQTQKTCKVEVKDLRLKLQNEDVPIRKEREYLLRERVAIALRYIESEDGSQQNIEWNWGRNMDSEIQSIKLKISWCIYWLQSHCVLLEPLF